MPASESLACADCHSTAAISCSRCHRTAAGQNLAACQRPAYPRVKGRFDFAALGYPDDPAVVGGRFRASIGPGLPTR